MHQNAPKTALDGLKMPLKTTKKRVFGVFLACFWAIFGVILPGLAEENLADFPIQAHQNPPDFESQLALSPAMSADVIAYGKGEKLIFQRLETPQAVLHILIIPNQAPYTLNLAVANRLNTLPEFAQKSPHAISLINAGYFDPANGKSISHLILPDGTTHKTLDNERLTNNEALTPYLEKFDNRPEFRRYECLCKTGQRATRYQIAATHKAPIPTGCLLTFAVGGGPMLLPQYTPYQEAFVDTDPDTGRVTRDPIGVNVANARTAVGVRANGDVVLVMAGQQVVQENGRHVMTQRGLSLPHLVQVFKTLGVETALNLDGGSSSGLVSDGTVYYGKLNADGKPVVRDLKSVLLVVPK